MSESLAHVSTSDLSRTPRAVLDRVLQGERLIISCHGHPLATLQPLDGVVVQPFTGRGHDIFGWLAGGEADECVKLSQAQRDLLSEAISHGKFVFGRLHGRHDFRALIEAVEDLRLRGLARKTHRGWVLTGRGMVLHESLARRNGTGGGSEYWAALGRRSLGGLGLGLA
jgi:antitoxin (DNA-binding transcriptional repressor) of toxin-antitoxin stability system